MVDLKMFLISILAAALLSGAVIGTVIWKNRTNHYSLIISKEHLAQQNKLVSAQKDLINSERKYQDVLSKLEQAYIARDEAKVALEHSLAQYRNEHGRLLVRGSCSSNPSSIANQAPGSDSITPSTDTNGSCELSGSATEAITSLAIQAQELRNRAQLCKEYAEEIEKQREDLAKQAK